MHTILGRAKPRKAAVVLISRACNNAAAACVVSAPTAVPKLLGNVTLPPMRSGHLP